MIFQKKKRGDIEQINETIEKIDDLIFNIRYKQKRYEREISKYLKAGKAPPPALLVGWKATKNIIASLEGYVASLYNSLMLNELGEVFKTVTGKDTIDEAMKALEKIFSQFRDVELVMKELMKQQEIMIKTTQQVSSKVAQNSENLEAILDVGNTSISNELASNILQEFAVNLPPELQKTAENIAQELPTVESQDSKDKTTISN